MGLHSGTHSKPVVIGGILTIAIADAFSDALGIHVSQESENRHSTRAIWESTLATFAAKFAFALTFILPIIWMALSSAIIVSIGWGLFILGAFSFYLAKEQRVAPWPVVTEHVVIALVVIMITHVLGDWVRSALTEGGLR